MVELIRKKIKLTDKEMEYIQTFKELKTVTDDSTALRLIIDEHQELKNRMFDLNYITNCLKAELIKDVSKFISADVLEEIRRVRLGTNNTDRNTQVLIELVTSWMILNDIEAISSTDKFKPEFLKFAEGVVHKRITLKKQLKDNKQIEIKVEH